MLQWWNKFQPAQIRWLYRVKHISETKLHIVNSYNQSFISHNVYILIVSGARICGRGAPEDSFTSEARVAEVRFVSGDHDNQGNYMGFELYYTAFHKGGSNHTFSYHVVCHRQTPWAHAYFTKSMYTHLRHSNKTTSVWIRQIVFIHIFYIPNILILKLLI